MTIPGYFFTINYVIDHNGDVVDIKGYPEMKKTRAQYEEVYSDLIANLFNEELWLKLYYLIFINILN